MNIAEVSEKFDITADTLRYYERIGLIPQVPRNRSGIRNYDEESLGWVEFVKCMRGAGIPIEALIEYVALFQQGVKTACARKKILIEQREILLQQIEKLKETLDRLDYKIERYNNGEAIKAQKELIKKQKSKGKKK